MSLPTLDNEDNEKKKQHNGLPMIDMPAIDDEEPRGHPEPERQSQMPSINEQDEFEEVSVNEALYEKEDNLNEDIYEEIEKNRREREIPSINESIDDEEDYDLEDDYYPEYEEDLKKEKKSKFINKKKKRLIPFGGKKSKKKRFVKSSDFDDRKNKLAKTKIMQFSIIILGLIMFFVGLKNTFAPSHVYTGDQIRQFAAEGAGQTGFPSERGRFFVENFMEAYLNIDKSKPELMDTLSYYYGAGQLSNSGYAGLNMEWNHEAKQKVLVPPKVTDVELLSDYSAQYKVSAYVSDVNGKKIVGDELAGRWLSFSVNLYYDEEDGSLAITQDSPTIIPNQYIGEHTSVPEPQELGNGIINTEILPAISPTIDGFIETFAKASIESHDPVKQYIDDEDDISLYGGFNGAVQLAGEPEDSIQKVVYNKGDEGNEFEADVTVKWIDSSTADKKASIEYTARYKMSIRANDEGKFSVTEFTPFTYYK